jgi:hypothetical protein
VRPPERVAEPDADVLESRRERDGIRRVRRAIGGDQIHEAHDRNGKAPAAHALGADVVDGAIVAVRARRSVVGVRAGSRAVAHVVGADLPVVRTGRSGCREPTIRRAAFAQIVRGGVARLTRRDDAVAARRRCTGMIAAVAVDDVAIVARLAHAERSIAARPARSHDEGTGLAPHLVAPHGNQSAGRVSRERWRPWVLLLRRE